MFPTKEHCPIPQTAKLNKNSIFLAAQKQRQLLQYQYDLDDISVDLWDELYGFDELKAKLEDQAHQLSIQWPVGENPDILKEDETSDILLHGPTGTGKTSLVKALAKRCELPLFIVDEEITGESEEEVTKTITRLFQNLKTSRPCILLLENVDWLLQDYNKHPAIFHKQFRFREEWISLRQHTIYARTLIFGTTKAPEHNPSHFAGMRFRRKIFMNLPAESVRRELISHLAFKKGGIAIEYIHDLGRVSSGYSAFDIIRVYHEVCRDLIEEFMTSTTWTEDYDDDNDCKCLMPGRGDLTLLNLVKSTFTDLSPDQKKMARPNRLESWMLQLKFESHAGHLKTVTEGDIKKHIDWRKMHNR